MDLSVNTMHLLISSIFFFLLWTLEDVDRLASRPALLGSNMERDRQASCFLKIIYFCIFLSHILCIGS